MKIVISIFITLFYLCFKVSPKWALSLKRKKKTVTISKTYEKAAIFQKKKKKKNAFD